MRLPHIAAVYYTAWHKTVFFVFPACRRASPAAVKETSLTDLENKAEAATTTSAQTAPADTGKLEVDHPKTLN